MPKYNLSTRAEKVTVESDWVILHNLSNLRTPKFLKINVKDVAEIPHYGFDGPDDEEGVMQLPKAFLPRQILGGDSPDKLRPWLTVFIKDGFPGGNYEAYFCVDDNDKIWYFERAHGETPPWSSKRGHYYPNKELEEARIPYWGKWVYRQ